MMILSESVLVVDVTTRGFIARKSGGDINASVLDRSVMSQTVRDADLIEAGGITWVVLG